MTFAVRTIQGSGGGTTLTTLLSTSLTAGQYVDTFDTAYGYDPYTVPATGSIVTDTFTYLGNTITIESVYDDVFFGPTYLSYLYMSGFTSDPGASFLYSVKWGAYAEVLATGSTYNWDNGLSTASWVWNGISDTFGMYNLGTGTLVIKGYT